MKKKRLLYLSQWFDPEFTFKGLSFVKELSNDFEVEVLTGFPNYPHGRVYSEYRLSLYQLEYLDQVPVHRVFLYPSHNSNPFSRSANYISFFISVFLFLLARGFSYDVIYVYHPPILPAFAATLFKSISNIKIVVDVQDLWPDTLLATGMFSPGLLYKFISLICKYVYHNLDTILVLSNGFKNELISRGVFPSKINVVYNWCNENLDPCNIDVSSFLQKMVLMLFVWKYGTRSRSLFSC